MPETLLPEAQTPVPNHNRACINLSFLATALVSVGQQVKLDVAGTISPVTAATDVPIGIVEADNGNNAADLTRRVTIKTNFFAVERGRATAAIVRGAQVSVTGFDATTKTVNYTTSVTGNIVAGIALEPAAAAGDRPLIALFHTTLVKF